MRSLILSSLILGLACPVSAAVLVHDYQLDGSLTDALGGPSLTSLGGSVGPDRYTFGKNQGLRLVDGLVDTGNYGIEFVAEYDTLEALPSLATWKKMLDFQDLASDRGLYAHGDSLAGVDRLRVYRASDDGPSSMSPNEDFHVILTRDSATGMTTGYVDGVEQWTFLDADPSAPDCVSQSNILHFFVDDNWTASRENTSGSVDFIRIYDGSLSAAEAAALADDGSLGHTPEPGAFVIWSLMGVFFVGAGWYRRRKAA
ncbi:MAG: hypothetical protein ACYSWU_11040 [Planctomycetota bacterium]|jgi:hypothetical protein